MLSWFDGCWFDALADFDSRKAGLQPDDDPPRGLVSLCQTHQPKQPKSEIQASKGPGVPRQGAAAGQAYLAK